MLFVAPEHASDMLLFLCSSRQSPLTSTGSFPLSLPLAGCWLSLYSAIETSVLSQPPPPLFSRLLSFVLPYIIYIVVHILFYIGPRRSGGARQRRRDGISEHRRVCTDDGSAACEAACVCRWPSCARRRQQTSAARAGRRRSSQSQAGSKGGVQCQSAGKDAC